MHTDNIVYSIPGNEYISKIVAENYKINPNKTVLHRNSGGMIYFIETAESKYVFKVYSSYDLNDKVHAEAFRAEESFNIIHYLHNSGFSVPKIYAEEIGRLYVSIPLADGIGIGALFEFIDGSDVEFDDISKNIAKTTAFMHGLMKNYTNSLTVLDKEFYIGRMIHILHQYYGDNSIVRDLEEFGNFAYGKIENLPKSFCHGDYGTHNISKKDNNLYVFDFDAASGTYPMYDITLVCDATNFWSFDKKTIQKTKENILCFAEIYTKDCSLSQTEIDSFIYFLALRQYEVRATVAHNSIYKIGTHFLSQSYLDGFYAWIAKFINYISGR